MRSIRSWSLLVTLSLGALGCGAPSEVATSANPSLAHGEQAVTEALACSAEALDASLSWTTPTASDQACSGPFSYVRWGRCTRQDTACPLVCAACADAQVTGTTQLTEIPGICVGRRCRPDESVAREKCAQAAERIRASRHPVAGSRVVSAVPSQYTGRLSIFGATCTYQISVPQTVASAGNACECTMYVHGRCEVHSPMCSSTRVATAPGLTYAEADALVGTNWGDAPWDPAAGVRDADLSCSTCEDLPLPDRALRTDPAMKDQNSAQVQAKFDCLSQRRAQLPRGTPTGPTERSMVLLYELWGEFLSFPQRNLAAGLYTRFAAIPGLAECGGEPTQVPLTPECPPEARPTMLATLARCERLTSAHVNVETRRSEVFGCGSAISLLSPTYQCVSPEYKQAMQAVVAELFPKWQEPVGPATSDDTVLGTRWVKETLVGVVPRGYTCPPPTPPQASSPGAPVEGAWRGGMMFGARPLADQPLSEDGGIFCRYTYEGPEAAFSWDHLPVQLLPCTSPGVICGDFKLRGAQWLHPDARVAAAQAPGLLGEMKTRLEAEYLSQMDAPLSGAVVSAANKVDLAIVDSLGDSGEATAPIAGEGHGRALAVAAYRVACPEGDAAKCPINFRSYRAFEPGTIASLSDLAAQIVNATDASKARGTRLVINVSLGLHPRLAWWDLPDGVDDVQDDGAFTDGVLLPAFLAVKAALNYASANGVITIAAAGNTDGSDAVPEDERSDELLYPAAFDGQSGWSCNLDRQCTAVSNRSLVFAAGGVTDDNQALPNARLTGEHPVPFLAPACNVALDNQLPGEAAQDELPIFCGTSFGAIGVSTVIAATWAHLPGASPEYVISVVRGAGIDVHSGSEGCQGNDCRVRMCESLRDANAAVTCGARPVPPVDQSTVAGFVGSFGVPLSWAGAGQNDATDTRCESDVVYGEQGPRNPDACPALDYASSLPGSEILVDQPGNPRCRTCGVTVLDTTPDGPVPYLVGSLEPDETDVSSPSLKFDGHTYELSASLGPLLEHGGSFAIPLLPSSGGATGTVAAFSYLKHTAGSEPTVQVDPLPVLR